MAISIERGPYEILVRFGPDFQVAAAHVQFAEVTTVDGAVKHWEPKPAVDFPINSDFISAAHNFANLAGETDLRADLIEAVAQTADEMIASLNAAVDAIVSQQIEASSFPDFKTLIDEALKTHVQKPEIIAVDTGEEQPKLTVLARLKSIVGLG
jgi:pectin methylesterase-like acyl-CoA thioesterase